MATIEPLTIGDLASRLSCYSTRPAALNALIQSFTTSRDLVEDADVKALLESVLVFLSLVRVRFFARSLPFYPLIGDSTSANS